MNLIDVYYNQEKTFQKISSRSNKYIENCFEVGLDLMNNKISDKFINGPISKKTF